MTSTPETKLQTGVSPRERFLCTTKLIFPGPFGVLTKGVIHTQNYFKENLQPLLETIRSSNFVGVENDYFLRLEQPIESPGKPVAFSSLIIKLAWEEGKPVICTDPVSQSIPFAVLDTSLAVGGAAILGLSSKKLADSLGNNNVTRRDFLYKMLMFLSSAAILNSKTGHAITAAVKGCEVGPIPRSTIGFSYEDCREALTLLGYYLLGQKRIFHPDSVGVQFIGGFHPQHYADYLEDGIVSIEKIIRMLESNAFYYPQMLKSNHPTARVWVPQSDYLKFKLEEQIAINMETITS